MTGPLSIRVNDEEFSDWLSFSATFDMEAAASTFEAEVSQRWQPGLFTGPWQIPAGADVQVYADGELILTGFVDVHTSQLSAEDHRVQIGGRSRSGALVDSSIIHDSYMWRDRDILSIAREICAPFGIDVTADGLPEGLRTFKVDSTGRAFEALKDLANRSGFILQPTPEGGLRFERAAQARTGFQLTAYTDVSVTWDFTDRHSEFIASGQRQGYAATSPVNAAQVAASIRDAAVQAYRPLIMPVAGNVEDQDALTMAAWAKARSIGSSLSASATVPGLRDPEGNLWKPNSRVWFTCPQMNVDTELMVKAVTFRIDDAGAVTDLSFTHPAAYDPAAPREGDDLADETGVFRPPAKRQSATPRAQVAATRDPGQYVKPIDLDGSTPVLFRGGR